MENLKKSLGTLRKENAERKSQIVELLEELLKKTAPHDAKTGVHMLNLFEYEKKVHEKLTEMLFGLHALNILEETPAIQPQNVVIPDPNIQLLVANTSRLIAQLTQATSSNIPENTENENSIKKPNNNSNNVLINLSDTPVVSSKSIQHKENLTSTECCGYFENINKTFPEISRSCSSTNSSTQSIPINNECTHFPELSPIWPELNKICLDVTEQDKRVINTSKELEDGLLKNIEEYEFSIPCTSNPVNKLLCVDESTESETEGSLFDSDLEQTILKDSSVKLNNVKEESVSSETEGSVSNEMENAAKMFGIPTSVLKSEHSKNFAQVRNNLSETLERVERGDVATQSPLKDCNLSANFTAEEKILKLGVVDRKEAFEKSRASAPLPDLRLLPSEPTNTNPTHYVINDSKITKPYANCIVIHADSPSEFYIHLLDDDTSLLELLNQEITHQYKKSKTPFRTKKEVYESLGNFYCAFVKSSGVYYRAEVIDWLFDNQDSKLVRVQLVDYGRTIFVHFKHLRTLTKQFAWLPKFAIKCYLPMLYPPGSSKSNLLQDWPPASIDEFKIVTGSNSNDNQSKFQIVFNEDKGDITAVDLAMPDQPITIGQLLIKLGHAVEIILPEDDPMGIISDEEDIQKLEECNNVNEVVLGYDPKDEGRICKFTLKDGTCFKGKNCTLEHVQLTRGGYTSDKILTFVGALNRILLPSEDDHVYIRFTVFIDASHYYINLTKFVDSLVYLENVINDNSNIPTLKPYKITPAFGEIVLVKHWTNRWLRAKIKHHSYNLEGYCTGVQAFMVDYGDIIDVSLTKIRHIKPEYLELPFQGIECVLYDYKMQNATDMRSADKFFYENMVYRNFIARIIAVTDMLCIRVYHKNCDLGEILCEKGFLRKVTRQIPSEKAQVIPSG